MLTKSLKFLRSPNYLEIISYSSKEGIEMNNYKMSHSFFL